MNTEIPRIVVINLQTSVDRRRAMQEHLHGLGLVPTFFDAIDGRKLVDEDLAAVYDHERAKTTHWGELTRGEIGCALSHRAVWADLIASGDAGWLVLEDDAVLASDVPRWLGQLPGMVSDGEVVPLVYTTTMPYWFRRKKIGDRWLVYANQGFYRATAYYVTPLAARRLLQASMPLWFPIDFWYGTPGYKGVTPIRPIWPAAVTARDEGVESSTIGVRQALEGKRFNGKRKGGLRKLISFVRRYLKNRFFLRPVRIE
ncbi:MAG: glycosyltransferase family 25 protein [Azonexus sp.]